MKLFGKIIEKLYLRQENNLAYYDALTKVKTRIYFDNVILKEYEHKDCYVFMFDMNGLKQVNDLYGHATGSDYIINTVYDIQMLPYINPSTICRIGGDEFIAISDWSNISEKDLKTLNNMKTVSYGMVKRSKNESLKKAVQKADALMYANKRKYKASIVDKL